MKMKRMVSFLLVFVMLFCLFTGCGQQDVASQPDTESQAGQETMQTTELKDLAPPRIAEELIPRLNAELEARGIPLEFVYQGEYDGRSWNTMEDIRYSLYQAKYSVDGTMITTNTFDLSIDYKNTPADPMVSLQIWLSANAPDRERELHKTVCAIAAQLCDPQISEETAEKLISIEPSNTPYAIYAGEIGSLTKAEASYIPVSDDPNEDHFTLDQNRYRVAFCQSTDMTHTVYRQLSTEETWYELYFGQTPETLFRGRILYAPSVEELEQRINDALVRLEVPITCTMMPYLNYGQWDAVFRWSTLEDPDYAYPEYPYEEWGQIPEEVEEEQVTQYIQSMLDWVDLTVYTEDPFRKNAPVSSIHLSSDSIAGLADVLFLACAPENGVEDFSTIQGMTPVPGRWEGYEERILQKVDCSITQETNIEQEYCNYSVEYHETGNWYTQTPSGEELLDPVHLDYEFQIDGPMVVDGRFNIRQGFQTYFRGNNNAEELVLDDILSDFLLYTRSQIAIGRCWFVDSYGLYRYYYGMYGTPWASEGAELDRNTFRIDDLSFDDCGEVYMRYNINVEQYLTDSMDDITSENILLAPIGLGLLLDEALTPEEAVQLQTHVIEYDYIADEKVDQNVAPAGCQITVYGTGDVVHVLGENPESGDHYYTVMTREYMKTAQNMDGSFAYAHLEQYLDD